MVLHRRGVVAVDARDRMADQLARLGVGHRVDRLESLDEVATAGLHVGAVDRGVAVEARARLLRHVLAFGEGLVLEHVGVPALLAEVDRKRVARPHRPEARILGEPRLGHHRAGIGRRRRARHRFAPPVARAYLVHGAAVAVVLEREVLAPHRRILGVVAKLDNPVEGIPRLLLALEDVDQERGDPGPRRGRGQCGQEDGAPEARSAASGIPGRRPQFRHRLPPCRVPRRAQLGVPDRAVAPDA